MMWYFNYNSSHIGKLTIYEENDYISKIEFDNNIFSEKEKETELIFKCYTQLEEYFKGQRMSFDLPLNPKGSDFQLKVWQELLKIPYGETRSYSDIALALKSKNYARAVGSANNKNPIPIIIPCHRVIGKNNTLVGYAGGLQIKKYLLDLEKTYK
ncbi:methylated-DNA--[protein]-cysteine S-methyltransferase [Fusobacterium sp.]|uniref:methylated-DNA--[protein]-cysteine S-methyltransferase n=1 Tax=Fusobacterium sp. TaxID=68766 RepID=UPI00396C52B5